MATIDEAEGSEELPWGFHDALLVQLHVDWLHEAVSVDLRAMITERQDQHRLLRLTLTGLEWLVIDPANPRHPRYDPVRNGGWSMDSFPTRELSNLPPVPEGAFAHDFWIFERSAAIHVCARDARWEWLEDEARPSGSGVFFPGEELPDFPER